MERSLPRTQPAEFTNRPTPAAWLLRLFTALLLWQQRARTRRQLVQLDERLLADAGISAAERNAELGKPFWR
ncbi:conserved hypothetical protein [Pseudomonas sp. 8AS]|uniref:DUF1127 domain-containing protein n=1 Tax=Pseudomonas sp. 8AS TaxID=2653163 RepID=UPI0012F09C5F|nr:DUF1127 domain-containing protein [Pseudomonas sp. 8AS]VXA97810.1 conserved hypothetical protein [Pseudomonas sp. 8AS]